MKTRTWIYICIVGVVLLFTMTGCQKSSNVRQPSGLGIQNGGKGEKTSVCVQAVVKGIDINKETITLYDIDSATEKTVSYNGATEVYSRNKVALLMSQLACGEIVEAYFNGNDYLLAKIQVSKEAWEYKKIRAIDLDRTEGIVYLTGRKYKYQQDVAVFCGTEQKMLIDLNERDEITVKGIGGQAYSFIVTKGHGYIRLGGHENFIGGSIAIDRDIFMKVEENMLIAVGEGEHTIVVENKGMQVVEKVQVMRDQEYFFDMSTYEPEEKETSKVKFVISPSNAVLFINGKLRDYSHLIILSYGNYTVTVRAEGYQDYTGILHVKKSDKEYESIYIDLVADNSTTDIPKASTTPRVSTTPVPLLEPEIWRTAEPVISNVPTNTKLPIYTELPIYTITPIVPTIPTVTEVPAVTKVAAATKVPTKTKEPAATKAPANTKEPTATKVPNENTHKIYISKPVGASVYVNGGYKGVAPLSFPKILGNVTITLSKSGCQTKSYSITVADDGEDVEYSFAELAIENDK